MIARLFTLMVKDGEVAEAPAASVTLIVKVDAPWVVGVPEIVTESVVLAPRDNPPGSAPDATDHMNGAAPPEASTAALYAAVILPEGSEVVATDRASE